MSPPTVKLTNRPFETGSKTSKRGICREVETQKSGDFCLASLECSTGLICLNQKCAPGKAEGEACNPVREPCQQGLVCVSDKIQRKTLCRKPTRKRNETCDTLNLQCQSGLVCWGGRCLQECNPASPGATTCPTGETCKLLSTSRTGGFCYQP